MSNTRNMVISLRNPFFRLEFLRRRFLNTITVASRVISSTITLTTAPDIPGRPTNVRSCDPISKISSGLNDYQRLRSCGIATIEPCEISWSAHDIFCILQHLSTKHEPLTSVSPTFHFETGNNLFKTTTSSTVTLC